MSAPTDTRRNNSNSSLQVQADHRALEEIRLQAQQDSRTVDELRARLRHSTEASRATRSELLQSEAQFQQAAQSRIEFSRGQLGAPNVEQGQAATLSMRKFSQSSIDSQDRINAEHLQRMEANRVEKRRQREAEEQRQREAESTAKAAAENPREAEATASAARTASTSSSTTAESTQVMDMQFCINNLNAIRAEAGDFALKDFSDYWAPDNE
jgi:colicin import membrane protein